MRLPSKLDRILDLALMDYLGSKYQESLASVAAKHMLDVNLFEGHVVTKTSNDFFTKWERYNQARLTTYRQAARDGKPLVLRPSWYTGSVNSKSVPRHHVLWCLEHEETEIPPGYVIFHPEGNYATGVPSEYVCLTRSEHQYILNKRRTTNGLPPTTDAS